jgi:hypothetical protein
MDELEWVKWAFLSVLGGFVFMIKRELSNKDVEIQKIKDDIQNLKDYKVHKDDLRDFKVELRVMFDELKQDIRAIRNAQN